MNANVTLAMLAAATVDSPPVPEVPTVEINADAFVKPTDLSFATPAISQQEARIAAEVNRIADELMTPRPVYDVFNVGNRYQINVPHKEGEPEPIVRTITNKIARRILRKRGGENRIARKIREAQQQRAYARTQVDSSHEAKRLLEAQREYQTEQRRADSAPKPTTSQHAEGRHA